MLTGNPVLAGVIWLESWLWSLRHVSLVDLKCNSQGDENFESQTRK